jgi:hypothetical protein
LGGFVDLDGYLRGIDPQRIQIASNGAARIRVVTSKDSLIDQRKRSI